MSQVINIMGGPGIGKSTFAAKIFFKLKEHGLNAELVTEVAKDIVYEEQLNILKDQLYVFAKQNRRMERLKGKVDFIVTDSPGILSLAYQSSDYYPSFEPFVVDVFNSYNNINFMLTRNYSFKTEGRVHDESTSKNVDNVIKNILEQYEVPYFELGTDEKSIEIALDRILK